MNPRKRLHLKPLIHLKHCGTAVHADGRGTASTPHQNAEVEASRVEWLQYEAVLSSARDMRTMEGKVAQRAAERLTSLAHELNLGSKAAEMAVQVCLLLCAASTSRRIQCNAAE